MILPFPTAWITVPSVASLPSGVVTAKVATRRALFVAPGAKGGVSWFKCGEITPSSVHWLVHGSSTAAEGRRCRSTQGGAAGQAAAAADRAQAPPICDSAEATQREPLGSVPTLRLA